MRDAATRFVGIGLALLSCGACRTRSTNTPAAVSDDVRGAVLSTVLTYVNGVSSKDTARMRSVLGPGARFETFHVDGADAGTVTSGSVESTFSVVASRRGVIDAHIRNAVVQVIDGIASVWTPYEVLVDGRVGWCGVDHFTLVRRAEGWRISSVNYTRKTTSCVPLASHLSSRLTR